MVLKVSRTAQIFFINFSIVFIQSQAVEKLNQCQIKPQKTNYDRKLKSDTYDTSGYSLDYNISGIFLQHEVPVTLQQQTN